ncbi:MAG: alpha/beta hydrolase [Victivallaceae bacterium]|nr:alpha/beta hydrolase [Victivallaceae bacterium]
MNWKRIALLHETDGDHPWRRMLIRVGILLAVTVVMMGACVDSFIFHPPAPAKKRDPRIVMLPVAGTDEKIAAIYTPPGKRDFVFLYSHGNAEDLSTVLPLVPPGCGVLVYDYEGYGASTGSPGEKECYRDIETAYRFLIETQGIPPRKMVVYGFSVGSGPACYLAEKYPVGGLVLESPFTSTIRVVLPFTLPIDRFPNIDRIRKVRCPILIFHGTADHVIPLSHGKTLSEAAPGSRFVPVSGADHGEVVAGGEYLPELEKFVDSLK